MNDPFMLSREQARELDRRAIEEFGIPGIVLMENAGRGIVDYLLLRKAQGKIMICCGKGNNAGDGFVVARHLDNHHIQVHVLLFADPLELRGEAKVNYDIVVKSAIPLTLVTTENFNIVLNDVLPNANWIIDALFGTGLQGAVQSPYDKIIRTINDTHAEVVAVDIPSGLDCDTGIPLGSAVKATHTVTFVGYKKGFAHPDAKQYLGNIHIVDIGMPRVLMKQ